MSIRGRGEALRVHAVCFYRGVGAGWPAQWREVDLEARNLIQALRQPPTRSPYDLPFFGGGIGLGSNLSNRYETPLMLASRLLLRLMRNAGYEDATIIPIPSSRHLRPAAEFVGGRIARAITRRDPAFVNLPALYFAHPVPQSMTSRRRTETALRVNLRAADLRGARHVVLLDDVMTTGTHLRAAAAFLADRDIRVDDAFVVARLATECPDSMFEVPVITI